jgi:hypothetical protein
LRLLKFVTPLVATGFPPFASTRKRLAYKPALAGTDVTPEVLAHLDHVV